MRSDVDVDAFDSYCISVHLVKGEHLRSDVVVGALVWNSVSHLRKVVHSRSLVPDGAFDSYWSDVQVDHGVQVASVVLDLVDVSRYWSPVHEVV